jgi:hypothetical protein
VTVGFLLLLLLLLPPFHFLPTENKNQLLFFFLNRRNVFLFFQRNIQMGKSASVSYQLNNSNNKLCVCVWISHVRFGLMSCSASFFFLFSFQLLIYFASTFLSTSARAESVGVLRDLSYFLGVFCV